MPGQDDLATARALLERLKALNREEASAIIKESSPGKFAIHWPSLGYGSEDDQEIQLKSWIKRNTKHVESLEIRKRVRTNYGQSKIDEIRALVEKDVQKYHPDSDTGFKARFAAGRETKYYKEADEAFSKLSPAKKPVAKAVSPAPVAKPAARKPAPARKAPVQSTSLPKREIVRGKLKSTRANIPGSNETRPVDINELTTKQVVDLYTQKEQQFESHIKSGVPNKNGLAIAEDLQLMERRLGIESTDSVARATKAINEALSTTPYIETKVITEGEVKKAAPIKPIPVAAAKSTTRGTPAKPKPIKAIPVSAAKGASAKPSTRKIVTSPPPPAWSASKKPKLAKLWEDVQGIKANVPKPPFGGQPPPTPPGKPSPPTLVDPPSAWSAAKNPKLYNLFEEVQGKGRRYDAVNIGKTGRKIIQGKGPVAEMMKQLLAYETPSYLAFDIETGLLAGEAKSLGVASISFRTGPTRKKSRQKRRRRTITVHGAMKEGGGFKAPNLTSHVLSKGEAGDVVRTMLEMQRKGTKIVGWNSAGFDFPQLARASGLYSEVAEMALHHYDMMYQTLAKRGFRPSLKNAGIALGLGGKQAGMTGEESVEAWRKGRYSEVLRYGRRDAVLTGDIFEELTSETTKKGNLPPHLKNFGTPLTVMEADDLPLPTKEQTNWMKPKFVSREAGSGVDPDLVGSPQWIFSEKPTREGTLQDLHNVIDLADPFVPPKPPPAPSSIVPKVRNSLAKEASDFFTPTRKKWAGGITAGLIGLGIIGHFSVGQEAEPEPAPWYPRQPGSPMDIEMETEMGLQQEGLYSIGDFSSKHHERVNGKAGLVQWLWDKRKNNSHGRGQAYYLGNHSKEQYMQPAASPVRSRAGTH